MNDLAYSYPGEKRRKKKSKTPSWLAFLGLLALCYAVAAIGARIAAPEIHSWYDHLVKPRHNPPNWIFAPVWTVLYTFMAIAAWLVWRNFRARFRKDGLVLFGLQLALNLAWTFTFFHLHRLLVAVVVILCLWAAILFTAMLFWQVRRIAGVLMLLYLAWVSFAIGLNLVILRLN